MDRQSDNSACYHGYGEGFMIKEQRVLCGAVRGAETFTSTHLSKRSPPFIYLFSSLKPFLFAFVFHYMFIYLKSPGAF